MPTPRFSASAVSRTRPVSRQRSSPQMRFLAFLSYFRGIDCKLPPQTAVLRVQLSISRCGRAAFPGQPSATGDANRFRSESRQPRTPHSRRNPPPWLCKNPSRPARRSIDVIFSARPPPRRGPPRLSARPIGRGGPRGRWAGGGQRPHQAIDRLLVLQRGGRQVGRRTDVPGGQAIGRDLDRVARARASGRP